MLSQERKKEILANVNEVCDDVEKGNIYKNWKWGRRYQQDVLDLLDEVLRLEAKLITYTGPGRG